MYQSSSVFAWLAIKVTPTNDTFIVSFHPQRIPKWLFSWGAVWGNLHLNYLHIYLFWLWFFQTLVSSMLAANKGVKTSWIISKLLYNIDILYTVNQFIHISMYKIPEQIFSQSEIWILTSVHTICNLYKLKLWYTYLQLGVKQWNHILSAPYMCGSLWCPNHIYWARRATKVRHLKGKRLYVK